MFDRNDYAVSVVKVTEDDETMFKATVREFPDLVVYGDTRAEALLDMEDVLEASIELLSETKKKVPPPLISPDEYSGRVTLRLPKTLHRECSVYAEAEGISLNLAIHQLIERGFLSTYQRQRQVKSTPVSIPRANVAPDENYRYTTHLKVVGG